MRWIALVLMSTLPLLGAAPASALYKCQDADGAVSFQQAPCMHGGVELEAGHAFGVRPVAPQPARTAPVPETEKSAAGSDAAIDGQTPDGRTIYRGPRGGRYTLSASGRKNYLPRQTTNDGRPTAVAPDAPPTPGADPQIHVGPRGGCYTLGSTGRKNYLPRERCPQD